MTFPVYIPIGPWTLHPHLVLEFLAYFIGFRLYLWTRRKERLAPVNAMWIIVAATCGAAIGSKLLYWFEAPHLTWVNMTNLSYLMAGKTIVGGLLGGLIAVEWTKKRLGITSSTGDDMVLPLAVAMIIGRIGCFLTGLSDHTYGTRTQLPWGIDFGDGIPRHPTQLYEAFLLLSIVLLVLWLRKNSNSLTLHDGELFQTFMSCYLFFRLLVDFIKPTPHPYFGLNNIQVACVLGLCYYLTLLLPIWIHRCREKENSNV